MGRFFVLAGAVLLAPSAFASYELALVLQFAQQPNNGPTTAQISRFDAASGAYMGRFGQGIISSGDQISLDPTAPGQLVVASSAGVGELRLERFNYSTGEMVSTTDLPVAGVSGVLDFQVLSDGSYFVAATFGGVMSARTFSSSGSLLRTYTLPSGTTSIRSIYRASNGNTFILSRQPGSSSGDKLTLSSYGNNLIVASDFETIFDNSASSNQEKMTWSGNSRVTVSGAYWSNRKTLTVTGTTLGTATALGGYVVETDLLLSGHGTSLYGYGYDSTNQRFYKTFGTHLPGPSGTYESVSGTTFQTAYDGVMVIAPEPGTMIVLGLGVAALARRRRQAARKV